MRVFLLTSAFIILSGSAYASDCDFDKPQGSCTGTISVDSTGGSRPSYSAEITVRSSAPSCSKVEYLVGSAPQTTILRGNGSEHESLFGTSPISESQLQVERCTAYLDKEGVSNTDAGSVAASESAAGSWQFKLAMADNVGESYTFELKEKGGKITGSGTMAANTGTYVERVVQKITGKREGGGITLNFKAAKGGGFYDRSYKLTGSGDTMQVADPFGRTATATRQ
jgi:hypothetical protein